MITKLINWLGLNLASILGITQAILKILKELLTAIVNIIFPLIPNDKFQSIIIIVRNIVNTIDAFIEKYKSFFLTRVV